jgi:uncharacterized protein involved in type VI secretion and phage assembly
MLTGSARVDGDARRHFGIYPALVTDIVDPDSLGRIQVKFPWLGNGGGGRDVRAWATLCTPYADDNEGIEVLPAVGTQVMVAFEAGDLRRSYILGACWNGSEKLPEAPASANNKRLWKTRSGSLLEFDDAEGAEKITLSTKSGHKLRFDNATQEVKITHSNGCVITMNAGGQIQIQANATVEVTASALNVHCATATFDGTVNCTTLIASSSVVSPSYTPGAGNIW